MTTKVDYLVVYSSEMDLIAGLTKALREALEGVYIEPPDDEVLAKAIEVRYTRTRESGQRISGVTVAFDTDDDRVGDVIKRFSGDLVGSQDGGVEHAVKMFDPALRRANREYAEEIFEIEMKLREALSFIFIDSYGTDFYALLKDVDVTLQDGHEQKNHVQDCCENEFFYLLFSDYIRLNSRRRPKKVDDLIAIIEQAPDFEGLRRQIAANPIGEERYVDFLASLRPNLDPIEKVRNCIAHNRSIPARVEENYAQAKEALLTSINEFLETVNSLENSNPDGTISP